MKRLYPRLKFADENTPDQQFKHIQEEFNEAYCAETIEEQDAEISDMEQAIQTYWDIRAKQGLNVEAVRAATIAKNKARGYEP